MIRHFYVSQTQHIIQKVEGTHQEGHPTQQSIYLSTVLINTARSTRRFEYLYFRRKNNKSVLRDKCKSDKGRYATRKTHPHSLSYHETTLWKVSFSEMHADASTILDRGSCTKSWDTTWWSVYPRMPLYSSDSDAALRVASNSAPVHPFFSLMVRSTRETSGVGQRTAMPVRTPLSSGRTTPTALAAPVEDGMRLATAALHDMRLGCRGARRA